jgi:hypothetical protein
LPKVFFFRELELIFPVSSPKNPGSGPYSIRSNEEERGRGTIDSSLVSSLKG